MKIFYLLSWLFILLVIFVIGVGTGVYYQNEILVTVRSLLQDAVDPAMESGAPPEILPTQSVLNLPGITDPLPLVYSDTLEEEKIQEYLKQGAVVLPLGTSFGEKGNVVVTAHSSGTAAMGPYRSAFARLSELQEGQEYTVSTPTATYTYRVYGKEIVWPTQVDRLPNDDRSTVTLVTCWPVFTNFKRLLVHTELIKTEYKT